MAGMRAVLRKLGFAALTVTVVSAVAAEVVARVVKPTPRRMVIRPAPDLVVERVQGIPLWWVPDDAVALRDVECQASRRVVVTGDSIFKGWGVPLEKSWSVRWREGAEDLCVHNYASSGYGHREQWALVQEALPIHEPDVLVYEVFVGMHPDTSQVQRMHGDSIFDLRGLSLDERGVPKLIGVPELVAWPLFTWSYAFQYVVISGGDVHADPMAFVPDAEDEVFERVIEETHRSGTELVFVLAHQLHRGFAFHRDNPMPVHEQVRALAQGHDHVHVVDMGELLLDHQVEEIRLDNCCHFNQKGQDLMAERLGPAVEGYLPGQ